MVVPGLLLTSLFSLALGKPTSRNLKSHEFLKDVPSGFSLTGSADPTQMLELHFALVESNIAELERRLYDVSTPSSPNYGKHLSKSEAQEFIAPAQDSVDAVNTWLKDNNITADTISPSGDWLSFEIPVGKANELFDTDFSVFTHDDTGMEAIRTLSYSTPAELRGHLDLIHLTVTFPDPVARLPVLQVPAYGTSSAQNFSSRAIPSSCSHRITPACLEAIYNIPTAPATQSSNQLAVPGFIKQYASEADVETFLANYRHDISSNTTFTLHTLDGGLNPQDPSEAGIEASLDVQYTVGVATGVPTVFISVGLSNVNGFLDVAHFLLNQEHPPNVLTTSYGFDECNVSPRAARNLCNKYAQLGMRGVSVLFSSGDGGVSGPRLNNTCTAFIPTFPSGCPFVTSVGASQGVPETAADFSSGCFSNIFSTPAYQAPAVYGYLASLSSTYRGRFSPRGRAFPDVAAQGVGYEVVVGGKGYTVDSTSASSPAFASVIALLNDRLIAKGRSPLGFLNPFLYTFGAGALNDVTAGSNPGCSTSGFPAKEGWDPVTGLGTPDFAKLARAVGLQRPGSLAWELFEMYGACHGFALHSLSILTSCLNYRTTRILQWLPM